MDYCFASNLYSLSVDVFMGVAAAMMEMYYFVCLDDDNSRIAQDKVEEVSFLWKE